MRRRLSWSLGWIRCVKGREATLWGGAVREVASVFESMSAPEWAGWNVEALCRGQSGDWRSQGTPVRTPASLAGGLGVHSQAFAIMMGRWSFTRQLEELMRIRLCGLAVV